MAFFVLSEWKPAFHPGYSRSKVQFQSLRFSDSDEDPANGSGAKAVKAN